MTLSQNNSLYGELKRLYHGNIDFLMYKNQIDDGICLYPKELDIFCRSIIQFHNSPKYQNKMITLQMTFADCVYYTLSKIDEGTSLRKVSMTTKLRLLMAKMIYGFGIKYKLCISRKYREHIQRFDRTDKTIHKRVSTIQFKYR